MRKINLLITGLIIKYYKESLRLYLNRLLPFEYGTWEKLIYRTWNFPPKTSYCVVHTV